MSAGQVEHELARLRVNERGTLDPRTSVLNLVVVAAEDGSPRVFSGLSELAERVPARTIVLVPGIEGKSALEVRPTAFCLPREGSGHICTERIEVRATGDMARRLGSFVAPLLLPDLPTFLYLPCDLTRRMRDIEELGPLADRLVVDSSLSAGIAEAFRTVASLQRAQAVSDLQWTALSPWRSLMSEMFAVGDRDRELGKIRSVEITHSPAGEGRALLMTGWLASSLGWEARERSADKVSFSTSGGEVECGLTAGAHDVPLRRVRLCAEHLSFQVSCHSELSAARATVMEGERTLGERTIHIPPYNAVDLLDRELRFRGRDTVYERSLRAAVGLLPA